MTDPTTPGRIVKYSERWWASRTPEIGSRRCRGHNGDHERCRKVAMEAQNVCGTHGGLAPQAKRKARQRIDEAADRMAKALLGIAESAESEAVKLAAVKDALDRAGMKAPTQVEVGVKQPYEELMSDLGGIATISRAESMARRGLAPESAALAGPTDPDAPIDVEFVDVPAQGVREPHPDGSPPGRRPADGGDGRPTRPAFATDDVAGPPGNALVSMEEAVAATSPRYVSSQRIRRRR